MAKCKILCAECQSVFFAVERHCVCEHRSLWPYIPGGQQDDGLGEGQGQGQGQGQDGDEVGQASAFSFHAISSWHRPRAADAALNSRLASGRRGRQVAGTARGGQALKTSSAPASATPASTPGTATPVTVAARGVRDGMASPDKAGERKAKATWEDTADNVMQYLEGRDQGRGSAHTVSHTGPLVTPSSQEALGRGQERMEGTRGRSGAEAHTTVTRAQGQAEGAQGMREAEARADLLSAFRSPSRRASRKLLTASMDLSAFAEEEDLYKVTAPTPAQVQRQERVLVHEDEDVHKLQGLVSAAAQAHRKSLALLRLRRIHSLAQVTVCVCVCARACVCVCV
jgi:hypothetical protein